MFSGGPTKKAAGTLTEAQSYLNLAKSNDYFSYKIDPATVMTEDLATDSYQNVLFSLLRFHQVKQDYPAHMWIVSHDFKKKRFVDLHCHAIKWPRDRLHWVGIDPPADVTPPEVLKASEEKDGIGLWKEDLYGAGKQLKAKRLRRGWENGVDMGPVEDSVADLLRWSGGETGVEIYPETLPWEARGD